MISTLAITPSVAEFVAGVYTVLGGLFLIIGVMDLIHGVASRSWDTVTGEIIDARSVRWGWRWRWWVDIRYRYTIEGLTFEGDRLGFWRRQRFWSSEDAEQIVSKYPKGQRVTLWVSPKNRAQAVIEPGLGWRIYMPLLLGALLFVAGVYGVQR